MQYPVLLQISGLTDEVTPHWYCSEEVGQLLGKHHGKFARVFSFMRGLLRSEHLCGVINMGSFRKTRVSGYNTSRK